MLLQILLKHGKSLSSAGDSADPYRPKSVSYELHLDAKGSVKLVKRNKKEAIRMPFLRDRKSGSGIDPLIFHDNGGYVLGVPTKKAKKSRPEVYRDAFWETQLQYARDAGDKEIVRVLEAAGSNLSWTTNIARQVKEDAILALYYNEEPIAHRLKIEAHLRSIRAKTMTEEGKDVCLTCGEKCQATLLHTKVKSVPGTGLPAALINFHAKTAKFQGLEQGNNFPMCATCVRLYTNGLQDLLQNHKSTILIKPIGLSVVIWGAPGTELFSKVIEPFWSDERKEAWQAIEKLQNSSDLLHILFLRGSKGRIGILSYNQRPAKDVVSGLLAFRDLWSWERDLPESQVEKSLLGRGMEHWPSIRGALSRTVHRKSPPIDPFVQLDVIRRILLRRPNEGLPDSFIRTLTSSLLPKGKAKSYNVRVTLKWVETHDFFKLGKRPLLTVGGEDMPEQTHTEEPKITNFVDANDAGGPYYIFGRLISLVDAIRRKANARKIPSKARELLTRAMTNPCATFGDLESLKKIYDEKTRGADHALFRELCLAIKTNSLEPKPMGDRARYLLTLGYEHQEAYGWAVFDFNMAKKKEKEKKNKESNDDTAAAAE